MPSRYSEIAHLSDIDKEEILREAERLLTSKHFRASRRYPTFLRFILQHTLNGNLDNLKERTLGIEIFGREPDYDTSEDSIVRVTAAEIRKRIALYNQDEGLEHAIQIELPFGSYVPHFRRLEMIAPPIVTTPETSTSVQIDQTAEGLQTSSVLSSRLKLAITAAMFLLITIATIVGIRYMIWRGEQKDLLAPLWKSPAKVTLCVGSPTIAYVQHRGEEEQTPIELGPYTMNNTLLPFADSRVLSRLQILLTSHQRPYQTKLAKATTLDDLRAGPVILLAAFDNPWTLRLTSAFRYHFAGNEVATGQLTAGSRTSVAEIVDSKQTQNPIGSHNPNDPPYKLSVSQDFAIVAITQDNAIDQPLILVAGIGPNGTMAAGEFLLTSANLDILARMAPSNWSGRNVEAVITTQVIDGNSGPPRIVAAEYW